MLLSKSPESVGFNLHEGGFVLAYADHAAANANFDRVAERGDADFRPVSRFLAAVFFEDEARAQAMTLRLMLHVRQTYQSIFDRLI